MPNLTLIKQNKAFGGVQQQYSHNSKCCQCVMQFSIFMPPQAQLHPVPVVMWLSGLTCSDENFVQKAGAQRVAAELGIALLCPDTSPRADGMADVDAWDMGGGAGFYVDASQAPWAEHYQMYTYVSQELPSLVKSSFPVSTEQWSISGHSMGGHGALTVGLKHPDRFKSISAFAPIAAPMQCPWGQNALTHYLGDDNTRWAEYDATFLLGALDTTAPILVDQGGADEFLQEQLLPHKLHQAALEKGHPLTYRLQAGYDHSYFFVASFIEDHLRFHARYLK